MATSYSQEGNIIDFAPAADVLSGALVAVGGLVGVAIADIATGVVGPVGISGVYDVPKTLANVVDVGDVLNFNATAGEATSGAGGTGGITGCGTVITAADGTMATVRLLLNEVGGTAL